MDEPIICTGCRDAVPPGIRTCSSCGAAVRSMTSSQDYVVFGLLLSPLSILSLYAAAISIGTLGSAIFQLGALQLLFFGGVCASLLILGLASPALIVSGIGRHAVRSSIERRITNASR